MKETTFTNRTLSGFVLKYKFDITTNKVKLFLDVSHNVIGVVKIKIENCINKDIYSNRVKKNDIFNGTFDFKYINQTRLEAVLDTFDDHTLQTAQEIIMPDNGTAISAKIENTEIILGELTDKFMVLFDTTTPVIDGLDGAVFGFQTIEDSGNNTKVLYNASQIYNNQDINDALNIEGATFYVIGKTARFFIENYEGKNTNLKTRFYLK